MKALLVLCVAVTLCLLALHGFAPELTSELIENFDLSDIISGSIISTMAGIIIWQERRLRKQQENHE